MSLYGALFSGVSGLSAQSQAMGMIADNITNVNTVGYKRSSANFSTLVTQSPTVTKYSPGGVTSRPQALIDRPGLLQASSSDTDIGISGDGFFVVNTAQQPTNTTGTYMFTRAGSFTTDDEGFLRNPAGLYLQAWPLTNGALPTNTSNVTALQTVNVANLTGTASPTTTMDLKLNLNSEQTAAAYVAGGMSAGTHTPHLERSIEIFDSKGGTRSVNFGFFRDSGLGANQWRAEIYVRPATDVTSANGLISSGVVAFNSDGTLDSTNTTLATTLNITTWAAALGLANSSITLGYGTDGNADGFTQFSSASELISSSVNGAVFGALSGVNIDEQGTVTALFDNGSREDIYQIPVATFSNPNGLTSQSGNAWTATTSSGEYTLKQADSGGAGNIAPASLEASNVDLGEEFTSMITIQRAYSAASRIITTSDDMLEELIRLKR